MRVAVVAAVRVVFLLLAAAAIIVAVRINMAALAAIGGSNGAFLAVVAIMSAAVKACVPLYREYFGRTPYPLAAVFALAIVFDVGCTLGFSAKIRADKDASAARHTAATAGAAELRARIASLETEHRASVGADIDRASARLAALEAAARAARYALRTSAAVRADIAAAEALAGDCRARGNRDQCQHVARLRVELADAEGRESAAALIDSLRIKAAAGPAGLKDLQQQLLVIDADAAAPIDRDWFGVAIAGLARDIGMPVPETWAARAFAVVLSLFVELLAICGLAVALRPLPATAEPLQDIAQSRPAGAAPPTPLKVATEPAAIAGVTTPKKNAIRQGAAIEAVRAWLATAVAAADGWIYTRQRELAAATGVSGASANMALRELAAIGAVEIRAGRKGTAIKRLP